MELEEAFRKRARARGGGGGCSAGGPDRLSSLPDCLLHTIMSFMKARQAVQTCVLSTRWRHLWRTVPCLDVDFDEFKKTACASDDNFGSGANDSSVPCFNVDHDEFKTVLASDINSGSDGEDSSNFDINHDMFKTALASDDNSGSGGEDSSEFDDDITDYDDYTPDSDGDSDGDSSDSDLDRSDANDDEDNNHKDKDEYKDWEDFEDFAVSLMHRCNIAQLDSFRLHIVGSRAPEFGNRHAAGWLRRAMKYCAPDRASQHVGLSSGSWRLKRLHLGHVLLDNRFAKRVTSVCCLLEDLELDDCTCEIRSITSHSLKTLVLKNCKWRNLSEITSPTLEKLAIDGISNTHDLVILAPAVAYLHLAVHVDHFRGGISINKVPSLAKASIHIQCHRYRIFASKLCGDQFKLLCSISNATSLELSGVGTTVLGEEPRFQEFKNLRNVLLDNCDLSDDFHTLVFFLQSSPILEKLTLRRCEFPEYPTQKKGMPILSKTSSSELRGLDLLCENLKVEIIYKDGNARELVKALLRVSVNLSKNNIKLTKVAN